MKLIDSIDSIFELFMLNFIHFQITYLLISITYLLRRCEPIFIVNMVYFRSVGICLFIHGLAIFLLKAKRIKHAKMYEMWPFL